MDWKTSKVIELHNNYNEKGLGQFSHLDNCNHVHYSLQLLLYSYLLKSEGYLKGDIPIVCKIVNIHPFGGFKKSKSYDVLDLKKEVKLLIK
jgi:hypothetical protein